MKEEWLDHVEGAGMRRVCGFKAGRWGFGRPPAAKAHLADILSRHSAPACPYPRWATCTSWRRLPATSWASQVGW